MNLDKKKKFIVDFLYFVVWVIIILLLFKVARIYLLPFLIGILIAYAVQKPSRYLERKIKISREKSAAVLSVITFLIIVTLFTLLCSFVYSRLSELIECLSYYSNTIREYFEKTYDLINRFFKNWDIEFQDTIKNFYEDAISGLISKTGVLLSTFVTSLIKKLPSIVIGCVVTVVATCYISKDYDKLLKFIKGILSQDLCKRIVDFKNIFIECFFKFVFGYFKIFIITFLELSIGFLLLNIKHFLILSIIVALLDMLPLIGTGTVLLPWAVVAFFQADNKTGFGLVIIYLIITIVRNFIEPKIIGKQIDINPLFTLLFIFIGLRLGGIIGMIVLPILLTVLFTYYRRGIADNN